MGKKRKRAGRKVRVDFKRNREAPPRRDDLTRQYGGDETDRAVDHATGESVRAKGALSRKRTIIVDEDQARSLDESALRGGIVISTHGLVSRVRDEAGRVWDCTVRRVVRTRLMEQRSSVTAGDRVAFTPVDESGTPRTGVIERIAERRTILSRRDRRGREHTIVANADQLLIVSSVFEPMVKPHLIDRYIVAALKGGLRLVIALNKIDLYAGPEGEGATEDTEITEGAEGDLELESPNEGDSDPHAEDAGVAGEDGQWTGVNDVDEQAAADAPDEADYIDDDADAEELDRDDAPGLTVESLIEEFTRLGYTCLPTSAATGVGVDELREILAGRVTAIAGQSGVGKSSLINAVEPGLNIETRPVSESTEKGRHTTTYARLHPLAVGGYVVDTPGIRGFELWGVEPPALESFFVEFLPHLERCRYRDCLHVDEEGCAVREAMERGEISARRYMSYVKMYLEAVEAVRGERAGGR